MPKELKNQYQVGKKTISERKLFLRVNTEKTKIVKPNESEFLGFGFWKKDGN